MPALLCHISHNFIVLFPGFSVHTVPQRGIARCGSEAQLVFEVLVEEVPLALVQVFLINKRLQTGKLCLELGNLIRLKANDTADSADPDQILTHVGLLNSNTP